MEQVCPVAPKLDFGGTTPYEDYVRASVLHTLQRQASDDPREMSFLVTTQVMELYFGLLCFEWRQAQKELRADDVTAAVRTLRRSELHMQALNAAWRPIARMTPGEFNSFRDALGEGSGFQSGRYREVEFLLGEKSRSMLVPHRSAPAQHDALEALLSEPSLYDDVLAALHRRGLDVPDELLKRDFAEAYAPDERVEAVWAHVYREGPRDLLELGEALTDVAEEFSRWRHDHLLATRRSMGSKVGTGGSAGVAWLEKRVRRAVFPELWTARSYV
ncbi:tryptophan 2,3-dioxygenase [Actinosynnema pretiosum subsp. pretiosum]|uniref:Tryptophan 2,3-dioxygenase n=3 Tax=Actinosynnema TaxID=40566 RepID=C6WFA3_ACTMD|nr:MULTISPECIES: tryptophan 2,3-dioxygenase family protein [Actinosynnema]ACU34235.1 tryptophan 23-dioxygenase [Actinosynnema mirum DSM 43827]ATE52085.1 tryptophan 2,3-dioxygenase [Actinosynnema pretiosum]QUF01685.1 tryptophan 2,3-dioxygenase [Actinosynnema pretiosum subsp. pretiosum]